MTPTDPIPATVAELLDKLYASELAALSLSDSSDLASKLRAIATAVAASDAFGAASLRSAADHIGLVANNPERTAR